jgi:hypothetical protein
VSKAFEALQTQLADVGHAEGILTLNASGSEQGQDFSESGVKGSGGLKVLNGGKNVRGHVFGGRNAVELLAKMLVTKCVVTGKDE